VLENFMAVGYESIGLSLCCSFIQFGSDTYAKPVTLWIQASREWSFIRQPVEGSRRLTGKIYPLLNY
jgi:hypothetical protein